MRRIAACLLAALIVSATACRGEPTPQITEGVTEPVAEPVVVKSETEGPPPPEPEEVVRESSWGLIFEIPPSLEEMIVKSSIVARVRLRSVEAAAVRRSEVYTGLPSSDYNGALALHLDVLEYLMGAGGQTLTAYAYGFKDLDDEYTAATVEEATLLGRGLLGLRDTRWDDREAIVMLRYNEAERHYFLGLIRAREDWVWDFTVASTMWKSWLPAASAPGDQSTTTARAVTQPQRFLLDDPANYPPQGAVTRSVRPNSGTGAVPSTTLSDLRGLVGRLSAELGAGDGSERYRDCVRDKYQRLGHVETVLASGASFDRVATSTMPSGMPAGTRAFTTFLTQSIEWRDTNGPRSGDRYWTEGPDSDVLVGAWPSVVNIARPLPAGEYRAWNLVMTADELLCDALPQALRRLMGVALRVEASANTVYESLFDPQADGDAVSGTTTAGVIGWRGGEVRAALTLDVTGHALDFIGLDGTTTLSLVVADATESAGALTWSVPTQPWSADDKLMLRVRRHEAPTPTPTPTATPTPTPTATPTPTPAPTAMCLQTGATIAAAGTPTARRSPWSCPRRLPVPIQARVARA